MEYLGKNRTFNNELDLSDISYGDGQFVAVGGADNVIITSSDGITWEQHSVDSPVVSVAYGNGVYIATVLYGGILFTSPDGSTWTKQSVGENIGLSDVAYINGRFVAVGMYKYDEVQDPLQAVYKSYGILATSTDGVNWSTQKYEYGLHSMLGSVSYQNGQYVIYATGSEETESGYGTYFMILNSTSLGDFVVTKTDDINNY